jgi:hypothetical protein
MSDHEGGGSRVFLVKLRPLPGCSDPIKALRGLLKVAARRFLLKCTDVRETEEIHDGRNSQAEARDT